MSTTLKKSESTRENSVTNTPREKTVDVCLVRNPLHTIQSPHLQRFSGVRKDAKSGQSFDHPESIDSHALSVLSGKFIVNTFKKTILWPPSGHLYKDPFSQCKLNFLWDKSHTLAALDEGPVPNSLSLSGATCISSAQH